MCNTGHISTVKRTGPKAVEAEPEGRTLSSCQLKDDLSMFWRCYIMLQKRRRKRKGREKTDRARSAARSRKGRQGSMV
jgi:hypothetical protein